MASLVIFDFDGTIFDTHGAIEHVLKLTFDALLPNYALPHSELHRIISRGMILPEDLRALHPDSAVFKEENWVAKYRKLYATHERAFTKPFPGLRELLTSLRSHQILIAIVSNKATLAIKTVLERLGLVDHFPDTLIVGDKTPKSRRKPDLVSFSGVLVPNLKALYGENRKALMVGDTVTDIAYARNISMRICWCRYGQGDRNECDKLEPDFIIDGLAEVLDIATKEWTAGLS